VELFGIGKSVFYETGPIIARMVFSDFSHVCIEVKKGLEITRSHNNAGEYSSILECHAVTTW